MIQNDAFFGGMDMAKKLAVWMILTCNNIAFQHRVSTSVEKQGGRKEKKEGRRRSLFLNVPSMMADTITNNS